MPAFCGNCGAQLEAGDAFCVSCGARQSPTAGSQARPAPAAVASPHRGTPPSTSRASTPTPLSEPSGRIAAPSTPQAAVPRQPLTGAVPAPSTRKRIYAGLAIAAIVIAAAGGSAFYAYRSHQADLDANIVGSIKAKFFDDASLRKCTIQVTTQNGIVTLVGLVNTDGEKTSAVHIASQQPGVKRVVDQLVLSNVVGPPRTIEVPGNQPWTATGISLNSGERIEISATGNVSMGTGSPPMPPAGKPPDCGGKGGFPAGEIPCWSLIGRIGEQGTIFYVGSKITFPAPQSGQLFLGVNDDNFGDNSGAWTVTVERQPTL